jgi:branched-chain amino acid transport system ATP-binding protein
MTDLLTIRNLSVRYGASTAVSDVSLKVAAGSVTSLIGSNGAGKTTILRAISGLVHAASGSVDFDGRSLLPMAPEARAAIGIAHVPEGRHVFPNMTVRENLQLGAYSRPKGMAEAAAIEEIEALFPRLADRRKQQAGSLSGGEQQMLAIGRALMSGPRLIMMDEPTMGLSPQMIDLIIDTIGRLRQRGLTLLLIEQNAVEAIQMSDNVYALRLGKIVDEGPGQRFDVDRLTSLYLDLAADEPQAREEMA